MTGLMRRALISTLFESCLHPRIAPGLDEIGRAGGRVVRHVVVFAVVEAGLIRSTILNLRKQEEQHTLFEYAT